MLKEAKSLAFDRLKVYVQTEEINLCFDVCFSATLLNFPFLKEFNNPENHLNCN